MSSDNRRWSEAWNVISIDFEISYSCYKVGNRNGDRVVTPSISFPFKHGSASRDDVKTGLWELAEITQFAFDSTPKFHMFLCRQTVIDITYREVEDVLG